MYVTCTLNPRLLTISFLQGQDHQRWILERVDGTDPDPQVPATVLLNKTTTLSHGFKSPNVIVFRSTKVNTANLAPNTSINLKVNREVLLTVSFRPRTKEVVFSSALPNWVGGDRIKFKGFDGPGALITIYDLGDRFQILFDNQTVHYYNKRVQKDVTSVSYLIDAGETGPLFADSLALETYSSPSELVGN
jgi:hypothetical protein